MPFYDSSSELNLFIFVPDLFFLVRKAKLASCHAPLKQTAGWRKVKHVVAMTIMAPSRIMKSASSDTKSVPWKPPASSTQRYILRAKMVMEEAQRPI
jgi:hypothetical protein